MCVNTPNPFKPNPKPAYPKNLLIIGAGVVIVSLLLNFGVNSLSQGSLLSQYWGGMLGIISGAFGLIGWLIIILWILLNISHRRKPPAPASCPTCGFQPPQLQDHFCRHCGTDLQAST